MIKQVITVNRKKYATGLFWQPARGRVSARNNARTLAHAVDRKLRLYTEYRSMIGLGARYVGHRAGMPSVAAEVAETFAEYSSFLAMFQVGKLFYLIAVRNGVILADRLFDNDTDARAEYSRLFEIPDWAALVAPGAWGMPRAIERTLDGVVTGNTHATLHQISRTNAFLFSGVLIGAFCVLLFWLFRAPINDILHMRPQIATIDPEIAAEYKRKVEEKNKELDEQFNIQKQEPVPVPKLVLPYEDLPVSADRANICYQAIGFLMQPVTGWNQMSAECNEKYASVTFRREYGTLEDFDVVAGDLMRGAFIENINEDSLKVRVKLPNVPTETTVDSRDAETISRDVITVFQGMGDTVDVNIMPQTITNGVDVVTLQTLEVAASSKLTPMNFMEIFDSFNGVYMTRCVWDAVRRVWNYEVIIYAK